MRLQAGLLAERRPRPAAERAHVHACHGSADGSTHDRSDILADIGAYCVAHYVADSVADFCTDPRAHGRTHTAPVRRRLA